MTDLHALTARLGLSAMIGEPRPLSGGLMHRVWRVRTTGGDFVVKAINPEVAARPGALENIEGGERIGAALANVVPAVAALEFGGRHVVEDGGCWYILYPYIDGQSAFPPDITAAHCAAIGDALGRMQRANVAIPGMKPELEPTPAIDWPGLLVLSPIEAEWHGRLEAALPKLVAWTDAANEADALDADAPVLTHRDLDPKNVLWRGLSPFLIDWEAAGYARPRRELLEVALYWADDGSGGLDGALCEALLSAYGRHMPLRGDWEPVFAAGRANLLAWLAYNVRRASGQASRDAEEMRFGAAEVEKTLGSLEGYGAKAKAIKFCL